MKNEKMSWLVREQAQGYPEAENAARRIT